MHRWAISHYLRFETRLYVVFGGHHPTALHKEVLSDFACVDAVVRGEGEYSFLELSQAVLQDRSAAGICGVSYRDSDGSIVVNPDRPPIDDLDQLPPPSRSKLPPFGQYDKFYDPVDLCRRAAVNICSSRGCPYSCGFCAVHSFYAQQSSRWRGRTAANVVDEIAQLTDFGALAQHVWFADDNFLVDIDRACCIITSAHAIAPQLTFAFAARADQIVRARNKLQLLARSGVRAVEVGIESGSDRSLARMHKDCSVHTNGEAIGLLRAAGIHILLDFIMFDPDACLDDLRENVRFLREYGFWGQWPAQLSDKVILYPGTEMLNRLQTAGRAFGDVHAPSYCFADKEVDAAFETLKRFDERFHSELRRVVDLIDRVRFSTASGNDACPKGLVLDIEVRAASLKLLPYELITLALDSDGRPDQSLRIGAAFDHADATLRPYRHCRTPEDILALLRECGS